MDDTVPQEFPGQKGGNELIYPVKPMDVEE